MAYLVEKQDGAWELRESRSTSRGPRSRTLASFRELTPEVVDRAVARADGALEREEVVHLARTAGAPAAISPVEDAAAVLLGQLDAGHQPRPGVRRLLVALLEPARGRPTDAERATAAWAPATLQQRGEALVDLLALVDRLPPRAKGASSRFPRIESA